MEKEIFGRVSFCPEKMDLNCFKYFLFFKGCYYLELVGKDKQVTFIYQVYEADINFPARVLIFESSTLVLEKASQILFPWLSELLQLQRYIEEAQDFGGTIH